MRELIDKEKVIEALKKGFEGPGDFHAIKYVLGLVDSVPTADPVRHGKWTADDGCTIGIHCSVCGYKGPMEMSIADIIKELDFCPKCGARMRQKNE